MQLKQIALFANCMIVIILNAEVHIWWHKENIGIQRNLYARRLVVEGLYKALASLKKKANDIARIATRKTSLACAGSVIRRLSG